MRSRKAFIYFMGSEEVNFILNDGVEFLANLFIYEIPLYVWNLDSQFEGG